MMSPTGSDDMSCVMTVPGRFFGWTAQSSVALCWTDEAADGMSSRRRRRLVVERRYDELGATVRAVASGLLEASPRPALGLVALYFERSYWMIVAILGTASAGGCYVPLDPAWPEARLRHALKDCGADDGLIVTTRRDDPQRRRRRRRRESDDDDEDENLFRGVVYVEEVAVADKRRQGWVRPLPVVEPSAALYCMYTSGTTGTPKGVVVEHWGLLNRLNFLGSEFPLRRDLDDAVLLKAFYGFGVSEWEIFWPLCSGARLAIAASGPSAKDADYIAGAIRDFRVSHVFIVPSQLDILACLASPRDVCPGVRYLFSAGEALRYSQCAAARETVFPQATMCNLFGPTEADVTYFVVPEDSPLSSSDEFVPAGWAIPNSTVELLDADDDEDESSREICFVGHGVARGYLNRRELTAAKFEVLEDGRRRYRTGDRGAIGADGALRFLGRRDGQVKVRGVRIELGQVESGLRSAGASNAVAGVIGSGAEAILVAWILLAAGGHPDDVRAKAKSLLSPSELPTRIIAVDSMPLTTNGKIDRRALKEKTLATTTTTARDGRQAPPPRADDVAGDKETSNGQHSGGGDSSSLEATIMWAWSEVLGGLPSDASSESSFETFGATSLSIGRLVATLRKNHGLVVSMTDVFVYSSASKLASRISSLSNGHSNGATKNKGLLGGGGGDDDDEGGGAHHHHSNNNNNNKPEHELLVVSGSNGSTTHKTSWKGWSSTRPTALIANVLTVLAASFVDTDAGFPAALELLATASLYETMAFPLALACATCISLAVCLAATLVAAALKALVHGRAKPGDFPLFGPTYLKWHLATTCFQHVALAWRDVVADTPLMVLVYRLFGGTGISMRAELDCFVYDPELVTIGPGSRLKRDAVVSGHALTRDGSLSLRPVDIAANCLVNQRAFVVSGTKLRHGDTVGAMATTDGADCLGEPPAGTVFRATSMTTTTTLDKRPRATTTTRGGSSRVAALSSGHETTTTTRWDEKERRKMARSRRRQQAWLRCLVGLPILLVYRQLPNGLVLILLSSSVALVGGKPAARALLGGGDASYSSAAGSAAGVTTLILFCWLYSILVSQCYFWLVVAAKRTWLSYGLWSRWRPTEELRSWILARLVGSSNFEEAVGPWINTEVLAVLYRCLGATIGKRVQMDAFYALDHELVTIGDNVVFGHGVTIETSTRADDDDGDERGGGGEDGGEEDALVHDGYDMLLEQDDDEEKVSRKGPPTLLSRRDLVGVKTGPFPMRRRERMQICDGAEVLDHCHLELGSRVESEALLGSTTLVPRHYVVAARSTSIGNVDQAPVVLRRARSQRDPSGPLEAVAKRRHESLLAWGCFNLFNACASLLLEPLETALWVVSAAATDSLLPPSSVQQQLATALFVFPAVELVVMAVHCAAVCALKWMVVGRYKAGNHAFYGPYHYVWVVQLLLQRSLKPLLENKLRGTAFLPLVYRCFGATVGTDCCLMSTSVEYDLLSIGDRTAIGFHAVLQPHTVEHMVIKLGPFTVGRECAVRHNASVMPDTELEDSGQLLEQSLLPKGCVVAAGTTWAGLPAREITGAQALRAPPPSGLRHLLDPPSSSRISVV